MTLQLSVVSFCLWRVDFFCCLKFRFFLFMLTIIMCGYFMYPKIKMWLNWCDFYFSCFFLYSFICFCFGFLTENYKASSHAKRVCVVKSNRPPNSYTFKYSKRTTAVTKRKEKRSNGKNMISLQFTAFQRQYATTMCAVWCDRVNSIQANSTKYIQWTNE